MNKSILIIDHNPASRIFLAAYLGGKEFTVLQAPTGKEGLISAWRDRPDAIVFDPTLTDLKDVDFIHKLRNDSRTARTPLIALSTDPSVARREACLNAGVNEYIIKSSRAVVALDESLSRLFGLTPSPAAPPPPTPVVVPEKDGALIVFLSAKGGTGASSLCANLAADIQQAHPNQSVVVVDLVLPVGSIGPIVGDNGELNLATVTNLPAEQTTREYFHNHLHRPEHWQFQLVAGSPDPGQANAIQEERLDQVIETLRTGYDFVVVDIGRSLSPFAMSLIQKAELIVLIVSTELSAVRLTKTVWSYLEAQGVTREKMYVVLNRATGLEGLTKNEAEEIIGLPIRTTMPYLGGNFAVANNANQPLATKYPTNTASIVLKDAAADMIALLQRARGKEGTKKMNAT